MYEGDQLALPLVIGRVRKPVYRKQNQGSRTPYRVTFAIGANVNWDGRPNGYGFAV
jgi:hypothetical protein